MRLLYITAEVPWPLASGYLRHFHFLSALGQRHEVTHLSLTRRGELSPEAAQALEPLVRRLRVFGAANSGGGSLRRAAGLRRAARRLATAANEHLHDEAFDAVLLSGKDTFPAMAALNGTPVVIDVCDATSLRVRGELAVAPLRRRPALALRLAELRRVERRLAGATTHLVFASERDRAATVGRHGSGRVVPNAVDLEQWTRRDRAQPGGARIAFTGVMGYSPNHDAALRLARDILPRVQREVPAAELVLAGRDPRAELLAAANGRPQIDVTGSAPDLRPHLEGAAVYCAPLRFASGIQNKLLEAMAMEMPVVTTAVAADGLAVDGEQPPLIVADDDEAIAAALTRLLGDPEERTRLARAGREYIERHFSWERSTDQLEAELAIAAGERS